MVKQSNLITGPTFEEMLHPGKIAPRIRQQALAAATADPLDPINLYNITWRSPVGKTYAYVVPKALTGVDAPIVVLYSKDLPTGSHKVGAAYSVLIDKELFGEVDPSIHTLVWPSTGNYGIGGGYVGCRMGFDSIVILPAGMSKERFERIQSYGARIIATPGCESSVKEIYDKCKELKAQDPERIRILNQFEVFGNYRFHYYVTGNTIVELAAELAAQGIGKGRVAAFCSAMGSGGTIAAGDRLKQVWPEHKIVGLEPIQCPTLFNNGYGDHDIQGIGDKHVTWIHNVYNMDALMCLDDVECKKGLQLLTEEPGWRVLADAGVSQEDIQLMSTTFGISGVCNVLGAIKTAKFYGLGKDDVVVTILTDAVDRYHSVMAQMTATYGKMGKVEAQVRLESIFHGQRLDWILEGTREARARWHNLKYYTWIEQQGKTVAELNAQRHQEYWLAEQARIAEIDARLTAVR
ncbi:MAG TPA: pyridoxal-phosphate dependent enzyme [Anaerolineae bacterium]|nr:pyridoxal-phosphate dependent enzyme [Anaerolineae bacterium]HQJ50311.1 pyridoxal-phosphate dependent enzyme [Anaerolineae bacterium]